MFSHKDAFVYSEWHNKSVWGWYVIKNAVRNELKSASRLAVYCWYHSLFRNEESCICKSCGDIEPSAFDFSLLSFITQSFTLCFIKESFCFARLELFHSFFNLLSLIKLLSSLALSAKWTLCGRRSVCMHVYTHTHTCTHIQKRSWIGPEPSCTSARICLIGCIHTRCPAAPEITPGLCLKECWTLRRRNIAQLTKYW